MKILAIDWGKKRIGLAIGDSILKISIPFKNIPNNQDSLKKISQIVKNYNIEKIVFGKPVFSISRKPNDLFFIIKKFSEKLKKYLKLKLNKEIEVYFVEEDYTSEVAKIKYGNSKSIDKYAALIILEQFLNQQK